MKKVIEKASRYLKVLQEFDVEEFEIESDNVRLRFSTDKVVVAPAPATVAAPPPTTATPDEPMPEPKTAPTDDEMDMEQYATIASPIVGTFYRRPSPEKPQYVEVGDMVKPEQPVCIVEAMKLMNEIKSNINGRVVKILIEDAQHVQAGQVLFLIDPM